MYDDFDVIFARKHSNRYPGFTQNPMVYPVSSGKLPYAHYSDKRFESPQIVFDDTRNATEFKGLNWDYDDRLRQYDSDRHKAAHNHAISVAGGRTVEYCKAYIKAYYPGATLKAIAASFNQATGYEYYIFGYVPAK